MAEEPRPVAVKSHRPFLLATSAFLFVLAVAVAVVLGTVVSRLTAPPYNPLIFPTLHVATPATVIIGKTQDVTVTTLRCNTAPVPVQYKAVKEWVSTDPAGTTVFVATTVETQPPGCTNNVSLQPVPDEVISRSTAIFETTHRPVTWQIQATDTPLHHLHPVAVTWTSTPIVVEGAAP